MDPLPIRHRLVDKGMTLVQLARLTGVPYDRLVRIVNGYRQPKPDEMTLLAETLELPLEAIHGGDPCR